ncbi:MAG TPA: hypothetical protein VNU71_11365 [Burkholderiaceae bacterium]|nr:hypothetical protein [Burkholderiaceae bacterium]
MTDSSRRRSLPAAPSSQIVADRQGGTRTNIAVSVHRPTMSLTLRAATLAVVFVACLVVLGPLGLEPPNLFDEGFVVSGAMMILRGWTVARDFYVLYGPAQYYVLASLYHLFGEDLFVGRAFALLTMAALGTAIAAATLVTTRDRLGWMVFSLSAYLAVASVCAPSPSYPALPSALLLMVSVDGFRRWYVDGSNRSLVAASLAVAVAGLFRWDFGLFGACAHIAAMLLVSRDRRSSGAARSLALFVLPWLTLFGGGMALFVMVGGAARWFAEVPGFSLREFDDWRGISFIAPTLRSLIEGWSSADPRLVATSALRLGFAALPFIVVPATLVKVVRALVLGQRLAPTDVSALMLALIALTLLNQMRVRPGVAQGFPAFVLSTPLIGYCLRNFGERRIRATQRVVVLGTAIALLLPVSLYKAYSSLRNATPWQGEGRASHLHIPAQRSVELAEYPGLVAFVRDATSPEEAIYSGPADTSRLFWNDAALYFLAGRPAATRWIQMDPGLSNTADSQREIVAALERHRVRVVVLWAQWSNEPNRSSRSNDVHILDSFLQGNFVTARRFGDHEVLIRRASARIGDAPAPTGPSPSSRS